MTGKVFGCIFNLPSDVAHRRGCVILSRLSMFHQNRFHAFGWIGLWFMEPTTTPFDLGVTMKLVKQLLGYEGYAYWEFFNSKDAAAIIEKNVSMHYCLLLLVAHSLTDR